MIMDIYLAILGIALLFGVYSFVIRDMNNYTHIITAFISGVLYLILGYSTYQGITTSYVYFNGTHVNQELIAHTPSPIASFLCLFGGIMIVYAIILCMDLVNKEIDYLE